MSVANTDLRYAKPITIDKRSAAGVSGVVDCGIDGINASRAFVILDKQAFSGKAGKSIIRIRHAAASGVTYASATAFSTALIASTATTSLARALAFNIDRGGGTGRFLRIVLSNVTASGFAGVNVILSENSKVPPTTTGFTSITHFPPNP